MKVAVCVYSSDPILQAGVQAQLRGRPEVDVLEIAEVDCSKVVLVVADEVDETTVQTIRTLLRNGVLRVVLVVSRLDDTGLLAGIEAGSSGFLRRSEATPERLCATVVATAAGDGSVPPDLLGRLLAHVGHLQTSVLAPRGFTLSGLSQREIDVLKLVAEGLETLEIAQRLCYSERTVKGVIHDVTTRFRLKNRAQAVAYAVRHGVI